MRSTCIFSSAHSACFASRIASHSERSSTATCRIPPCARGTRRSSPRLCCDISSRVSRLLKSYCEAEELLPKSARLRQSAFFFMTLLNSLPTLRDGVRSRRESCARFRNTAVRTAPRPAMRVWPYSESRWTTAPAAIVPGSTPRRFRLLRGTGVPRVQFGSGLRARWSIPPGRR